MFYMNAIKYLKNLEFVYFHKYIRRKSILKVFIIIEEL